MRGDDVTAGVMHLGDLDADDLAVEMAALAGRQRPLLGQSPPTHPETHGETLQRSATFSAVMPIEI